MNKLKIGTQTDATHSNNYCKIYFNPWQHSKIALEKKKGRNSRCTVFVPAVVYIPAVCHVSLSKQCTEELTAKITGWRIFQSIFLNNSTLVIINNTNYKKYSYFQLKNGVEILFTDIKFEKLVFFDIFIFLQHWCDRFVIT